MVVFAAKGCSSLITSFSTAEFEFIDTAGLNIDFGRTLIPFAVSLVEPRTGMSPLNSQAPTLAAQKLSEIQKKELA
jgi:hypothetical protein